VYANASIALELRCQNAFSDVLSK